MASISFVMVALGVLLLLLGMGLVIKRIRIAGVVISLLGLVVVAIPLLAYLYVAVSMR
jgi:hypothetical protein